MPLILPTVMSTVPAARDWVRRTATALLAIGVFVFSWLFRFNDPNGSFAGLTDDHFFYLVRGWQILFGDLPVRDFVDHGAPLFYYVGAAVQLLLGRGTLSELLFTVTVIALSASLTFLLAARASGSLLAGLAGVAVQVLLEPRFYNYPKLLVYAVAIPLVWRYADRPTVGRLVSVAVVTVIGFLFRHDHGVFVGLAMFVLLVTVGQMPWRQRAQHGLIYGGLCVLLVTPYLLFIEVNGGIGAYFRQASAWAERDRDRAPVVWPGLFDNPDGISEAARSGDSWTRVIGVVRDNSVAWLYYTELVMPFVAIGLLFLLARDAGRTGWQHGQAKIATVIALAVALDVGFLRSPLEARLADPSVPIAILVAWMCASLVRLLATREALAPRWHRAVFPARALALVIAVPVLVVLATTLSDEWYRRLDKAALTERWGKAFERITVVSKQIRTDWDLSTWVHREERPELLDLALYLNACTRPTDRVLVQAYIPQVLALSRRAFAGGHADLRPGFFKDAEAQRLTVTRLQRQPVPVVLLETGDSYRNFRSGFPLVTAYLDQNYRIAGTRELERYGTTLLVRHDARPAGIYEPLGWPCFGSGHVE
jgi:hypothetical protein